MNTPHLTNTQFEPPSTTFVERPSSRVSSSYRNPSSIPTTSTTTTTTNTSHPMFAHENALSGPASHPSTLCEPSNIPKRSSAARTIAISPLTRKVLASERQMQEAEDLAEIRDIRMFTRIKGGPPDLKALATKTPRTSWVDKTDTMDHVLHTQHISLDSWKSAQSLAGFYTPEMAQRRDEWLQQSASELETHHIPDSSEDSLGGPDECQGQDDLLFDMDL